MAHTLALLHGTWGRLAHVVVGLALLASGLVAFSPLGIVGIALVAAGIALVGLGLSGRCPLDLFAKSQPQSQPGRAS